MSTTALSYKAAERRLPTADSTPSSSVNISPTDSPRPSPSSTSLSSLASDDLTSPSKLVDTYGNAFEIPDYTVSQIHNAIPKHCFERSGLRGLSYVARDIASLAAVFYVTNRYVTPEYIPSMPV